MKRSGWIKRFCIGIALALFLLVAAIGASALYIWNANTSKSLLQSLPSADGRWQYLLYGDMSGFGDPAWYVYKFPAGIQIPAYVHEAHDTRDVLFWNYAEAGQHTRHAGIAFKGGDYLVFSRGGIYHSLYSIKSGEVLVNEVSPWHAFIQSREYRALGENPPFSVLDRALDAWKRNNLHTRIQKVIHEERWAPEL